ncbi:MAG: ATP-binding protein [Acidobacteria bacterium]|nr:ATP-binding protein [Acidobacteriota bacterium]
MEVTESPTQLTFPIIDTRMTVDAMRDSGYKSTTHALAELIDNSIESGATSIEVLGLSRRDGGTGRFRLEELAVLDNGAGMDAATLRGSLRYGHGTRRKRLGIGRFGLGLPNSSMSQARRVDVWSWQSDATNALRTRLSIDDVEKGASEVPKPSHQVIPDVYRDASRTPFGESGTLVVWRDLDRVQWRRASTTFRHTESLLGRIYRRFLASVTDRLHTDDTRGEELGGRRSIACIPLEEEDGEVRVLHDDIVDVRPNDPLYLMAGTSCPESFGPGPMFEELVGSPFVVPVKFNGQPHEVRVRASYARPHVRDSGHEDAAWPHRWKGRDAGHTEWGKHADSNRGISLVRSHRELQLDTSWVSGDDPRERWWTIEVDFPTALDEMFGVTNNKQGAMIFQRLSQYDYRRERLDGESPGDVRRRMEEEGDSRVYLLDLQKQIRNCIKTMRHRVRQAKRRRPSVIVDEETKADLQVTDAIKRRTEEGYKGVSDRTGEALTEEEKREQERRSLVDKHHLDEKDALEKIDETLRAGSRVRWIGSSQSSPAFFDVESLPNVIQVALNTEHPVHSHLYEVMHPDVEEMSEEEVRGRLAKAAAAFRILIYAWARYEEEQMNRERRKVRDVRLEWGKYAEEFFDEEDDSVAPTDFV